VSAPHADEIQRFSFTGGPVRGQWVRLQQVLDGLTLRQSYPDNVTGLLGEMLAAAALLADGIKFDGTVSLQSRGPGPLSMVLAECRARHLLRGIARWPEEQELPASRSMRELLGDGRLAITLMSSPGGRSYQGLISIEGAALATNLERYFANSEQLPTRLHFAADGSSVTGLLLQRLPDSAAATTLEQDQNDAFWAEIDLLAGTLHDRELAALPPQDLLRRLFAEHPIALKPPRSLRFECTCSRERSRGALRALGRDELLELLEEQKEISVTCEICGATEAFDAIDVHALLQDEEPRLH
jgi:molecular chaperone Hsp33